MKSKDTIRVNVLRHMLSEFVKAEKAPGIASSSVDYYSVLRKCAKQWEDAIGEYKKALEMENINPAQRDRTIEAIKKECDELNVIKSFIPAYYTREELLLALEVLIEKSEDGDNLRNMGKLMKEVCSSLEPHRVDKQLLASLIKSRITK